MSSLALAQGASAAIVIDILEVGADVKTTLSGGFNKAALGSLQGQSTGRVFFSWSLSGR